MGRLATSPLPFVVPNDLERVPKSAVTHTWVDWLHHPCRLGAGGSPMLQGGVWFGLGQRLPQATRPTVSATVPVRLDWGGAMCVWGGLSPGAPGAGREAVGASR